METEKFQSLMLEHLAKLTQEITELKSGQSELKKSQNELMYNQSELKKSQNELMYNQSELKKSQNEIIDRLGKVEQNQIRFENEQGEKIKALFDAREVQLDVNERILDTLHRMEEKLDQLSLKVSSHDSILKQVK